MVKGIGLGWGTPYMFRMAVRETGKVTYGVCLLDDNGEFSWNDGSDDSFGIKKDQWVQYTSAFDFTTGGDSYENELHSAHVDKPAFENAPIKTWEGEPMYIGLGFKNTLQTKRNRGMYHTMLPGAVSQVRFYTSKLSENEVTAVRNNPTSAGASKNSLKIWLDFENSNIETSGSHTTEWVEATAAPTALSYNAAFAGKASITATVQTSDDGKTVKEEKSAALTSGTGKIDLTGMADAKYVRVKTAFVSDLNSTESSVPVLNEYALTAGKTKIWNTLTDWEKGTFEGAAGHQPGHVYRNYAKDFANYGTIGDVEDSSRPVSPTLPTPGAQGCHQLCDRQGPDERHRQQYVLPECVHHPRHVDDRSRSLCRRGHHRRRYLVREGHELGEGQGRFRRHQPDCEYHPRAACHHAVSLRRLSGCKRFAG